jgi:hypothetical protein
LNSPLHPGYALAGGGPARDASAAGCRHDGRAAQHLRPEHAGKIGIARVEGTHRTTCTECRTAESGQEPFVEAALEEKHRDWCGDALRNARDQHRLADPKRVMAPH